MIEEPLNQIEEKLREKFRQIIPDDDYILRLKNRLGKTGEISLESENYSFIAWILLVSVGFGVIFYWLLKSLFHTRKQ
jgi:hypothetical protein